MWNHLTKCWLFFFISALFPMLTFGQAKVPKTNPMPIYMHYMPWFETPETSGNGQWGWHWTMNNKNPNIVDGSGKRQIASHYYPLIGPYASSDPDLIEYHLLLMKLSGIDGVLIDWYGVRGSNGDINNLLRNSNALIDRTDETGLKFGLILEDRFTGSIDNAKANIAYARDNYFNKSQYIRHGVGNDPLLGVFGPITFNQPWQWSEILAAANEDVEFLPLWYEAGEAGGNADGEYLWIYQDHNSYYSHLQNYYTNRAHQMKTVMGVAFPGFEDFYPEGGAGAGHFYIPHNNGGTLDATLNLANQYKGSMDMLQLATWNDFGEGTIFEPTRETGFSYLVKLQRFTGVPYTENDLKQVHRLFNLRKQFKHDGTKQARLNEAFNHFVALRINDAIVAMNCVESGSCGCSSVSGITINTGSISIGIGQTQQLSATIAPANACNKGISWKSSNTLVATVDANGLVSAKSAGTTTITATTNDQGRTAQVAVTVNPSSPGGTYYRIRNRWQGNYLLDGGEQVRYGSNPSSGDYNYQWSLEQVSNGYELKNRATGEYMHVENLQDYTQCTSRPFGWYSSRWVMENTGDGYVRFKNVWQSANYLHIENLRGYVQHGKINTAWSSAQWLLEPVTTSTTSSITLQAENYTNMNGVQTEATTDAGGGFNVGWLDAADWISYASVNFPTSGSYVIEYRVASAVGGGRLSSDLNAGSIQLGAIDVPNTGGWQNWTTIKQTVNVNAGTYNFGIYVVNGGWNINWIKITKQTSARMINDEDEKQDLSNILEIYPNPAIHELFINLPLDYEGASIKLLNAQGHEVYSGFYTGELIDLSDFGSGIYSIIVGKDGASLVKRFVKN